MNPEEQRENYHEMITSGAGLATWFVTPWAAVEVFTHNFGMAAALGATALGSGIFFKALGGNFTERGRQ